eukprot:6188126-Pleurochrysis_carterae.AAC.4
MAIQRNFWSGARNPTLAELYHRMRSIPMSGREGSMVGWDCVIEWLNAAIKEGAEGRFDKGGGRAKNQYL